MLIFILVVIALIIAVVLIVALVSSKEYTISTDIIIDRPAQDVFNYIKLIRNQEKYSKWVMADPNVKLEYTGTDGTVGFISRWQSNDKNVGVGEQEITKIDEGKGYEVEIRFKKPFEGISRASTVLEPVSDTQTKLINTFYTTTPFPMNLMAYMIKNMLKKQMDETLGNLKRNLEK
ncbi:MAG: hypothetical protein JWO03_2333 [Bacteroidetes bacterium]|nr:hypothetical protein [Bacteroidota bacterium]